MVCFFLNLHCIFTGQRFRVKLEMGRLGKALGMTRKQEVYKSSFCMKHRLGCFVISLCVWVGGELSILIGSNGLDTATDMSSLA